jgi:hypothetical protein
VARHDQAHYDQVGTPPDADAVPQRARQGVADAVTGGA